MYVLIEMCPSFGNALSKYIHKLYSGSQIKVPACTPYEQKTATKLISRL